MNPLDVLVVGSGPAAYALAAALAGRGPRVGMLAPAGPDRWPARYGSWADELSAVGFGDCTLHAWSRALVHAGDEGRHLLDRAYALVDNDRMLAQLAARCEAGGVCRMDGEAFTAMHDDTGTTVRLRDGSSVRARVVVDATGHTSALVRRPSRPAPAYQTAYGVTLPEDCAWSPDPDTAVLMDWRDPAGREGADGPATFLYAFRLPSGRLFVEETALAARPAVEEPVLRERLAARMAARGVDIGRALAVEHVWIPMGGGLPAGDQRVVGFGAAGGLVHPATGYSLVRSLTAAPRVGRALADALGREGGSPAAAARAGWEALWPADARRRHAIYGFGLEVLLALDPPLTRAFFGRFFHLRTADWAGYLGDRLGAAELAAVMGRFMTLAPRRLRNVLLSHAMGPRGRELAGSLVGSLVG